MVLWQLILQIWIEEIFVFHQKELMRISKRNAIKLKYFLVDNFTNSKTEKSPFNKWLTSIIRSSWHTNWYIFFEVMKKVAAINPKLFFTNWIDWAWLENKILIHLQFFCYPTVLEMQVQMQIRIEGKRFQNIWRKAFSPFHFISKEVSYSNTKITLNPNVRLLKLI